MLGVDTTFVIEYQQSLGETYCLCLPRESCERKHAPGMTYAVMHCEHSCLIRTALSAL
jgi:hypothetical protein